MDQELSAYKAYFVDENEEIHEYDACSKQEDYYNPKMFSLIGKGVICMIDGVPQNFTWDDPEDIEYFWKRIR